MVVRATREICVRVYDALRELRPEWHSDEPSKGAMTIVFSSNSRKDDDHLLFHVLPGGWRKALIGALRQRVVHHRHAGQLRPCGRLGTRAVHPWPELATRSPVTGKPRPLSGDHGSDPSIAGSHFRSGRWTMRFS